MEALDDVRDDGGEPLLLRFGSTDTSSSETVYYIVLPFPIGGHSVITSSPLATAPLFTTFTFTIVFEFTSSSMSLVSNESVVSNTKMDEDSYASRMLRYQDESARSVAFVLF